MPNSKNDAIKKPANSSKSKVTKPKSVTKVKLAPKKPANSKVKATKKPQNNPIPPLNNQQTEQNSQQTTKENNNNQNQVQHPEQPTVQSLTDKILDRETVNNFFILLLFIVFFGTILFYVYFIYKSIAIRETLVLNKIDQKTKVKRLNHWIFLWWLTIIFSFITMIYYVVRANQYATQWKLYKIENNSKQTAK